MFNLENVEDFGFAPVPVGAYPAYVEKAEFKTSKAGNEYLSVQFCLFDCAYDNRKIFENLNLKHSNVQVVNIALSKLKAMIKAGGFEVTSFKSEADLLAVVNEVRCLVKLGIKEDNNIIKGFESLNNVVEKTATPADIGF